MLLHNVAGNHGIPAYHETHMSTWYTDFAISEHSCTSIAASCSSSPVELHRAVRGHVSE
jgi:hypothetical protein